MAITSVTPRSTTPIPNTKPQTTCQTSSFCIGPAPRIGSPPALYLPILPGSDFIAKRSAPPLRLLGITSVRLRYKDSSLQNHPFPHELWRSERPRSPPAF